MNNAVCAVGAAVLATTVVGCSSGPDQEPLPPGELAPGTAAITINDRDLGSSISARCTPAGASMTITTGDDASGSTSVVSNADGLSAQSVYIRDLGGFTGSYNLDLAGSAEVSLTGNTYTISGNADGFDTEQPSFRTEGTFEIKAAC